MVNERRVDLIPHLHAIGLKHHAAYVSTALLVPDVVGRTHAEVRSELTASVGVLAGSAASDDQRCR